MIAGLLLMSLAGCVWLFYDAPRQRHGIGELLAATLAIAPVMTLVLVAIGAAA